MTLLVLPILVPLGTAALSLLLWHHVRVRRWLEISGSVLLLLVGLALLARVMTDGIQAVQIGNWPFPFGITLVADLLSALMVVLAGTLALAVAVYSIVGVETAREEHGYYPLLHILVMGVCGAVLTGDVFNLYVWFEVMLISSYVLMALGGQRAQLEGGIKYVTLNLISSVIFLTAVGVLYGAMGTLNMADLHGRLRSAPPGLTATLSMLFLVTFGVKSAIFPLFFWLPASYHTPPAAVTALFSGLLTKVGVYALVRFYTVVFVADVPYQLLLWLAGLTMVTGVLGAVAQYEFRRLLSFHIISQIGYLLMGLGLYTRESLAATVFFLLHVSIAKAALFLVSGITALLRGTYELQGLGGLYRSNPGIAALFFVPALALAGAPPLSGFFAKLGLIMAGLQVKQYVIVGVALGVSVLTLFSMIKIWSLAIWRPADEEALDALAEINPAPRAPLSMVLPTLCLAALTVLMGVAVEPLYQLMLQAADQLLDPAAYVRAVRGE